MDLTDAALLAGGGFVAGVVNTLAGGGSLLTVPLLVLIGMPGTIANGTNRVGVFVQSVVAAWRFRAEGVSEFRSAGAVLAPVAAGALLGAVVISRVADETFERLFGLMMLVLLVPAVWMPEPKPDATGRRGWPPWLSAAALFGIGVYGGALQAGVGIALLFALTRAGFDLVHGNAVKIVVVAALTGVAVPVFVLGEQVEWGPALLLAAGLSTGAVFGARVAVRGGERVIRPVLACAVAALAGHMLGLY